MKKLQIKELEKISGGSHCFYMGMGVGLATVVWGWAGLAVGMLSSTSCWG
jgi:bacteriocin-like protein